MLGKQKFVKLQLLKMKMHESNIYPVQSFRLTLITLNNKAHTHSIEHQSVYFSPD